MKKYFAKMDLWLLTFIFIYAILGAIMIYSASSILTVLSQGLPSTYYFVRQLIFVGVAIIFSTIFILKIPTRNYKVLSYIGIILIILALIGLFFYGKEVNGARGWYDLDFFSLQPSEFAKSITIIFMACYYNILINKKERNFLLYLIPLVILGIMILLILKQPDMGGAFILGLIGLFIFLSLPMNKYVKINCYKLLGIIAVIGTIIIIFFGNKLISSYQIQRLTFQNPCTRYQEATGYQVCTGFIAIKNSKIFGLGFGNSTQKYLYLPEAHTDFIFPIICEELGIIIGALIIVGYGFILYRILKIAKNANNIRNSIIAYGTFIYLASHIIVNLLGVLALMPLTGVPLPLLSYGGSFNINVIVLLFLCERVSIESYDAKIKEKIKKL